MCVLAIYTQNAFRPASESTPPRRGGVVAPSLSLYTTLYRLNDYTLYANRYDLMTCFQLPRARACSPPEEAGRVDLVHEDGGEALRALADEAEELGGSAVLVGLVRPEPLADACHRGLLNA